MESKIITNCDLVTQGNYVSGFKLNSLISDNVALKCLNDLTLPPGLLLINRPRVVSDYANFNKTGDVIDDELYETLLSSAEHTEIKAPVKRKLVEKKKTKRKKQTTRVKNTRKK